MISPRGCLTLRDVFDAAAVIGFEVVLFEDKIADAEDQLRAWASERGFDLIDSTRDLPPSPGLPAGLWVSVLRVHGERPTITLHRSQSRRPTCRTS